MVDSFSSKISMAATLPPIAIACPPDDIELRLLYNPFQPETVEVHQLEYKEGQTLAGYLGELPEDITTMIFHNGVEVVSSEALSAEVIRGDHIGLIILPMNISSGMKSILRMVAQIAVIAVGFYLGGPIGAAIAGAAFNVGMMLLFPPKKINESKEESSYGIDGAKNSSTENIPYPVVYGEFRTAGNFSDVYTENVGDDQYLYVRTVVCDGEIEGIYDIEINEQPLANFKYVEHRIATGTLTQPVNDWFRSSIKQNSKSVKLDTSWTTHLTTDEVDQVRFDVAFPQGLVSVNKKDGSYKPRSVTFNMEYRQVQPNGDSFVPVPGAAGQFSALPYYGPEYDADGDGIANWADDIYGLADVEVRILVPQTATEPAVEYRVVGSSSWTSVPITDLDPNVFGIPVDPTTGTIAGPTDIQPWQTRTVSVNLPQSANYEFRGADGVKLTGVTRYSTDDSASESVTVRDSRTRAIRKSFSSKFLDRGYYECRIRRTTAVSTDQYEVDEAYLVDVAEIDIEPVALRGTANLSMRIKLSDQLNQVPQFTGRTKGAVLQEYDSSGTPTVKRWSSNNAWAALDVLCGEQRGVGVALDRIDWPKWVEYADWCTENSIGFNGQFDQNSNAGDVVREILRVGHAMPVPLGTKISVAIDRPREPVMMFTQASMIKDTFQVSYLSMQDRANEFEVTYYDKTDRNKAKTIRYVDPKAVTFNETPRPVSVALTGVDNVVQARQELWRMIYSNRLIVRTVMFEAFMQAISLTIGDVALIQHDQMQWAFNGLTSEASNGQSVIVDQEVDFQSAGQHAMLIHYSAIKNTASPLTVTSIAGRKVLVSAVGGALTDEQLASSRLVSTSGVDVEIEKIENGGTYHTITLADIPAGVTGGALVNLYSVDVVLERTVQSVLSSAPGRSEIVLSDPFPPVESQQAFVFGRVEKVRKPYVLNDISGSGVERRRLSFTEYHEAIYSGAEVDIPIPTDLPNDRSIDHVEGLLFDYDRLIPAERRSIEVRVHWSAGRIRNYGGADVYMRRNGSAWQPVGSVSGATQFQIALSPFDAVEFKVVSYSKKGDRAPETSAPVVSGTLVVEYAELDPPTNITIEVADFEVNGQVIYRFDAPADATGVREYDLQFKRDVWPNYIDLGRFAGSPTTQAGLGVGTYDVRLRSSSPTAKSEWVYATFAVAVMPGSVMANFNNSNDRNGNAIPAPTLPVAQAVEHTLNTDGSANVSLEWLWGGNESTIDGFRIKVTEE